MGIYSESHICQRLNRIGTIRSNCAVTITGNQRKTRLKFVQDALGLAHGLIEVLGIKPGDIVAISALNSDLYLERLLTVTFVRGIVALPIGKPMKKTWKGLVTVKKILNGGGSLSLELLKDPTKFSRQLRFSQLTVEAILLKHPGVSRAVVVGLPDTRLTEMVVACIQIKDNWKWADYSSDHSAEDNQQCLSSEIL